MAIRLKTKWHESKRVHRGRRNRSRTKTLEDRAGVVGFNIWKVAQQVLRNMMEEEQFSFPHDRQVLEVMTELMAFLLQVVDRQVYGQIPEAQRGPFIVAIARHLANTYQTNALDMLGDGDYAGPFIETLNARAQEYAECAYGEDGPGYNFKRVLADHIATVMSAADNKWVLEWVMEIEAPEAVKQVRRLVGSALGIRPG